MCYVALLCQRKQNHAWLILYCEKYHPGDCSDSACNKKSTPSSFTRLLCRASDSKSKTWRAVKIIDGNTRYFCEILQDYPKFKAWLQCCCIYHGHWKCIRIELSSKFHIHLEICQCSDASIPSLYIDSWKKRV